MPYQVDHQLRAPMPGQPDGYYYWSNAWIVNASTDAEAVTCYSWIDFYVDQMIIAACQAVRLQVKRSPGMGGVYLTVPLLNEPGSIPNGSLGYTLLSSVRVDFFVGEEAVGYKRWRPPLRIGDIDNGELVGSMYTFINYGMGQLASLGVLAARDGRVIDNVRVSRRVRMWQLRHGTERRHRVVFA